MQLEVWEAFRPLDVPDDKALKAAVALSAALVRIEDETAKDFSRRDADIDSIQKEAVSINLRLATMAGDINLMKWIMDTLIRPARTVHSRSESWTAAARALVRHDPPR